MSERVDHGTRDPEQIEQEIERTREQLGDTVEALAAKADVKGQARAKVEDVKERVTAKKHELSFKAHDATPDSAGQAASHAAHTARENKVPLAVAGAAAGGLLLGWLIGRR